MSFEEGVIRSIFREEIDAGLSKREPKKPRIITKTMTTADKEYEIALPPNTKKFTMHMRETDKEFRLSFEKGRVAGSKEPYFTVPTGTPYSEDDIELEKKFKIYVACATAGKTVELIAWR